MSSATYTCTSATTSRVSACAATSTTKKTVGGTGAADTCTAACAVGSWDVKCSNRDYRHSGSNFQCRNSNVCEKMKAQNLGFCDCCNDCHGCQTVGLSAGGWDDGDNFCSRQEAGENDNFMNFGQIACANFGGVKQYNGNQRCYTCTCPNGTPTVTTGSGGTLCDASGVDCSACDPGYVLSATAAAGGLQTCVACASQDGCTTSGFTCSTTGSISTKLICTTVTAGFFVTSNQVVTACTTITNAATVTCTSNSSSVVASCSAGFFGAAGSGACGACTTITNAATVTCTSNSNSVVASCNAGAFGAVGSGACTLCTTMTNAATVTCTSSTNSVVATCSVGYAANAGNTACADRSCASLGGGAACPAGTTVSATLFFIVTKFDLSNDIFVCF